MSSQPSKYESEEKDMSTQTSEKDQNKGKATQEGSSTNVQMEEGKIGQFVADCKELISLCDEYELRSKCQGLYCLVVEVTCSNMFGKGAAHKLAIVGSLIGNNISKFPYIQIYCNGTKYKGILSLGEMVNRSLISEFRMENDTESIETEVYSLTQIAAALPFAYFMWIKSSQLKGYDISVFDRNLHTSLPTSLQYLQAAALPLPEKLRKAHIAFCDNYFNLSQFDWDIYRQQVGRSGLYSKYKILVAHLEEEEQKINLKDFEANTSIDSIPNNPYLLQQRNTNT